MGARTLDTKRQAPTQDRTTSRAAQGAVAVVDLRLSDRAYAASLPRAHDNNAITVLVVANVVPLQGRRCGVAAVGSGRGVGPFKAVMSREVDGAAELMAAKSVPRRP